jgi:signal transduction histidine kinase
MTSRAGWLAAPLSRLRPSRRTARLRLTLLYGGMFALAGAALLGFTFWLFDRATGQKVVPIDITLPGQKGALASSGCAPLHSVCGTPTEYVRAAALYAHWVDLHALLVQSGIALAVMVTLAFALGWLVAGRVLRPLRAITATALAISATSLHERLDLAGPDDEFKELADTLNGLFARLEASFTAQRNFVASAAHELRTPLTLDKTLLQLALRNTHSTSQQWRATGAELLESGQQQERILEALLTLATSEAGLGRLEPTDLAKMTATGLESVGTEAERRTLHLEASLDSAPLLGDPDLIARLVTNLLDNAVRHNVPGGTVDVMTVERDGHAVLSVANSGPVIPPGEIGRLRQPFQRLEATRITNADGHGLGLAIVDAIATAHGATLSTRPRAGGGLHVEVSFPIASTPSRRC